MDDFVVAASSMATWAGVIEGKVTRVKGRSAVYLDAIAALATLFLAAATFPIEYAHTRPDSIAD